MAEIARGAHIGPYRVEEVLPGHRGGFAQLVLGRLVSAPPAAALVAMKIARTDKPEQGGPDTFNRALSNEVQTLRDLKHPAIVRLYPIQVGERRYSYLASATNLPLSPYYYVMEYLPGGSLDDLLARRKVLELPLAIEIAYQIGEALDYMHARGYAHLDIKNNNILFRSNPDKGGRPDAVLIDFGAAQKELRRAEVEAGALVYLPPERVEVLLSLKPAAAFTNKSAADVYGLGVALYSMVTGELPFKGQRETISTAILTQAPVRPVELNPRLSQCPDIDVLVMQMLEKRPERRPPMKDVLTRLDQILPPPRMQAKAAHRAWVPPGWRTAALALALLVIGETAAGYALWPRGETLGISRPGVETPMTLRPADTPMSTPQRTTATARATATDTGGGRIVVLTPEGGATEVAVEEATDATEPTLVPTYTPRPTPVLPTITKPSTAGGTPAPGNR